MAEKNNFSKKYRFVFQSSPLLLKLALLITLVVAIVCLSIMGGKLLSLHAQTEALRHQAGELEQKVSTLEDKTDKWGTTDSITDTAGDELGMVDQDATLVPVQ